jgi:hypothetical protein
MDRLPVVMLALTRRHGPAKWNVRKVFLMPQLCSIMVIETRRKRRDITVNALNHRGKYKYHLRRHILPVMCIYVFHMVLTINSDYLRTPVGFDGGAVCLPMSVT